MDRIGQEGEAGIDGAQVAASPTQSGTSCGDLNRRESKAAAVCRLSGRSVAPRNLIQGVISFPVQERGAIFRLQRTNA